MRTQQNGSLMHCPYCMQERICKAIPPQDADHRLQHSDGWESAYIGKSGQRWQIDDEGLFWFRRGRLCHSCNRAFTTAEIDERVLNELIELRAALEKVADDVGAYLGESQLRAAAFQASVKALVASKAGRADMAANAGSHVND